METQIEFHPAKVYALFLNGTDTYYQPDNYCRDYPKGTPDGQNRSETISFLATCISHVGPEQELPDALDRKTKQVWKGESYEPLARPLPIRLIEGPDTFGTNTHSKIASAVASILGSIIEGKNIFNIAAHSRGAVEAILIAWELQRIKDAMLTTTESSSAEEIWDIICGNPDESGLCISAKNVRTALRGILDSIKDNRGLLEVIRQKFIVKDENPFQPDASEVLVNLFLIDPVPGNGILKLDKLIAWYDPNMFRYPAVVRNVAKICCRNEDSPCFDLLHTEAGPNTVITNHLMPGHHGTPTGNPYGRQGQSLQQLGVPEGFTAEHVQLITLYLAIDFFEKNGSTLIDSHIEAPLKEKYIAYKAASFGDREKIKFDVYNKIQRNIRAYIALNNTTYISPLKFLGWEWHEATSNLRIEGFPNRPMLIDANNNKSTIDAKIPFNSLYFVNQDHLNLFLKIRLRINPSLLPEERLLYLFDGREEDSGTSLINREDETVCNFIEEAIKNTISSLVQEYIKNNLPEDRKHNIISAINRTFSLEIPRDEHHYAGENLTRLGAIKSNLKLHLKEYLSKQIDLQVAAYLESLHIMLKEMRKYQIVDGVNNQIYIESLYKFHQLTHFADNLNKLKNNIIEVEVSEGSEGVNFKSQIDDKIHTIQSYARTIPSLIAHTLMEKRLGLPIQTVDTSTIDGQAELAFLSEIHEIYNLHTEKTQRDREEYTAAMERLKRNYQNVNAQLQQVKSEKASFVQIATDTQVRLNIANNNKDNLDTIKASYTYKYCNMQILSGFILAIGSLAVAAAFTVLALHALGIFASAGIGASGLAIIAIGIFANTKHAKLEAFSETMDILNTDPPQQLA